MRNLLKYLCLYIFVISCGHELDPTLRKENEALVFSSEGQPSIKGSYLVAFRVPKGRLLFSKDYEKEYQRHYLALSHLEHNLKEVESLHYLTSVDLSKVSNPELDELIWNGLDNFRLGFDRSDWDNQNVNIMRVDFVSEEAAQVKLKEWYQRGAVVFADPNYLADVYEGEKNFGDFAKTYEELSANGGAPWLEQIEIVKALEYLDRNGRSFDSAPLIAIMDSGVDYTHPQLALNIWQNEQAGVTGCGNDVHGCNTTKAFKGVLGNGDVWPTGLNGPGQSCASVKTKEEVGSCGHGTHVAGLAASQPSTDNSYGGSCPICKIVVLKVAGPTKFSNSNSIADSSIVAAFTYISNLTGKGGDNAIRIVNASFGKYTKSRVVEILVRNLKNKGNGTLVVAAAGNEDTTKRAYPAAFEEALSIGNVDDGNAKHESSNYGTWVDLSAPGSASGLPGCGGDGGIRSTFPGGGAVCLTGTSMAAPVVAGIAGLLLINNPRLSVDDLKFQLITTANPGMYDLAENAAFIPRISGEPFPVPLMGSGVANAFNAVSATVPSNRKGEKSVDRVREGCGVVAYGDSPLSKPLSWLILLLPLSFGCIGRNPL